MLSARNVIVVTIAIAVISVIGSVIALLGAPDRGGEGRDSYGTRSPGYRAIFDTLTELNIPVDRVLVPPTTLLDQRVTLVFWEPHPGLVNTEPVYLQEVGDWVRQGGRVVVAPSASPLRNALGVVQRASIEEHSILEELGLKDVYVSPSSLSTAEVLAADDESSDGTGELGQDASGDDEPGGSDPIPADATVEVESDKVGAVYDQFFNPAPTPVRRIEMEADGSLEPLSTVAQTLVVPDADLRVLEMSESNPTGRVTLRNDEDAELTLVASFEVGAGEIVVVGDPRLLQNIQISRADNAVLMSHLLFQPGRRIVFDEFYHGLTIRGNPMWLLTQPPYALLACVLLVVVGAFIWRDAVFLGPSLISTEVRRRSLGEYIEGMARFFQRAQGSQRFILQEVRDGALWSMCHRLHLRPGQESLDEVAAALARRDPQAARRLRETVDAIDERLAGSRPCTQKDTLRHLQRIADCL